MKNSGTDNDRSFEPILAPFARPMYVMAKPAGAMCNLACDYCYYLEKRQLYPDAKRTLMTDEVLEEYIRQYINATTTEAVNFTWHGGEATLRPLDFFRKAMMFQEKYANGHAIVNCLQTNGTLLTDEWCVFLRKNHWLVGLSIDGPAEFHDEYRRDPSGHGTYLRTVRAARMLTRHGVEWNAMAVVNDYNADYPVEFYRFFRDELKCRYLQFTPIVERLRPDGALASVLCKDACEIAPMSVAPRQWGQFLCAVFDEWVRNDVGTMFVQLFDATLANLIGVEPGVCTMARQCGHAAVMEWNGDIYCCDHFVFPQFRLGNIMADSLVGMMSSERQQNFGAAKRQRLSPACLECRWLQLCNGECPKNRFLPDNRNYLCEGYRLFFEHTASAFDFMASELRAQRPPANVMEYIRNKK